MKRWSSWIRGGALGIGLTASSIIAQPGDWGGRSMGGGLSVEQVLGMLAFDDQYAVTDEQLIQMRAGFKKIYAKRQDLMDDMNSGGDRRAMREAIREHMQSARTEVMATLEDVLNKDQLDAFNRQIQEAPSRRGQRGIGQRSF